MYAFADYHMHTKYSDGRATVAAMRQAAEKCGLEEIAITDHGPNNIGTGVSSARRLLDIREEAERLNAVPGVRVLVGVEADIIDLDGEIDVPENIYRELDLLLVGLHPYIFPGNLASAYRLVLGNQIARWSSHWKDKVKRINTRAVINALQRHPVKVLTHPGLGMEIEITEVARQCALRATAYEVNTGHLFQSPEDIKIAAACGTSFIVNSDAHYPDTVGKLEQGVEILELAGIPFERILNVRESR